MRRLLPTFAALLPLFLSLPAARSPVLAQQAVEISPDVSGEALFHLALEARRRGDERLASVVLERVVRLDPEAVLPRLEWAEVLLSLGEPGLVDALLMPVAERIEADAGERPDSAARFYRLRGNAAARARRKADALELYERAIALAPHDLGLRGLVVSMYRAGGDESSAARHLKAAVSIRPQDFDLRLEAGRALLAVHRFAEAEDEFRMALRIDLWSVPAWQGLGESLAGQQKWADAEEVYRGGIRLAPESAPLHELLGDVLMAGGRPKEAIVWYNRAAALGESVAPSLADKIEQAQAQLRP
ncbi:MAG TPA: tetratricopeptide repeat protein [Gemmatimonadota bacterium]|nr:tetratricopeptide repeat protein [Gemmatimonadota bacterium]